MLTHKPVHPPNPLFLSERSEERKRGELKMTNQTKPKPVADATHPVRKKTYER
jgi:hypothetical protein